MKALDTNVLVYHILNDSHFGKKARAILQKIEGGEKVLLPLAVLKETLFVLLAHGRTVADVADMFSVFQKDNIMTVADDFSLFMEGLLIATRYDIDPTDGVIAAIMTKYNISEIYSNDPDFDKIPGIKRIF